MKTLKFFAKESLIIKGREQNLVLPIFSALIKVSLYGTAIFLNSGGRDSNFRCKIPWAAAWVVKMPEFLFSLSINKFTFWQLKAATTHFFTQTLRSLKTKGARSGIKKNDLSHKFRWKSLPPPPSRTCPGAFPSFSGPVYTFRTGCTSPSRSSGSQQFCWGRCNDGCRQRRDSSRPGDR